MAQLGAGSHAGQQHSDILLFRRDERFFQDNHIILLWTRLFSEPT